MKGQMNRRRAWEKALEDPRRTVAFLETVIREEAEWVRNGYSDGYYARSLLDEAMKNADAETRAALLECGRRMPRPDFGFTNRDYPVYWETGEHVSLGNWPQKVNGENLPIEWIVTGGQGDTRILMTAYAIDCLSYNKRCEDITWERCDLRSWLAHVFYENAFSDVEKEKIIETRLQNSENSKFKTAGGAATVDKVFLPDIEDILNENVFENEAFRACIATPYAKVRGAYTDEWGHCRLWLRCPGDHSDYAACLNCSGTVSYSGNGVNCADHAIRPMICVRINSGEDEEEDRLI